MLDHFKRANSLKARLGAILHNDPMSRTIYGLAWGDPETAEPLRFIRDRWVLPYVNHKHTAVEIGPGGGRWTRYLLGFRQLYAVDYFQELLDELNKNFRAKNLIPIKNNGTDFPSVPEHQVDFVFSFGTFVHLDAPVIEGYLQSIRSILRQGGNVVLHYSDMTKIMARENPGFAQNTPVQMRKMVTDAGYRILEEDLTTMWHSSLLRFTS
jgi:hypothetical protein